MALKVLEEEVCLIVKEFSTSLGFLNVDSMKETAEQFKMFIMPNERRNSLSGLDDAHTDTEKDNCVISPSQKLNKSRRSMFVASKIDLSLSDEDRVSIEGKQSMNYNSRKSRKSVCVTAKVISSSSSQESDDDEVLINNDYVERSGNLTDNEDEVNTSHENDKSVNTHDISISDEEVVNNRPRKKTNKIESSSDEDEHNNSNANDKNHNISIPNNDNQPRKTANKIEISSDEEIHINTDDTRRKISYASVDDSHREEIGEDNILHDDNVSELTQQFQNQTICDDETKESDDEAGFSVASDSEKESSNGDSDSEGSLKNFIVSDDSSDVEDDKDKEYMDDNVFKTPAIRPKNKVLPQNRMQTMVTPFSATKRILNQIQTPKSVPGTPAYKREFKKIRDNVVKELFHLYNKTVFDNKLPDDLQITWNNRMTKTAGFCFYSKLGSKNSSRIELSDKVLDCTERVRDTLIHELCHSATWLINGVRDGHGAQWKYWATKANKLHPDLPIIMRCHAYKINGKFSYECNGCGTRFERFSKSIKLEKHRCAKCGGIPELVNRTPSTRPENPYNIFMKENFSSVKKNNPGLSHKDCMVKISEMFKASKTEKNKENIVC